MSMFHSFSRSPNLKFQFLNLFEVSKCDFIRLSAGYVFMDPWQQLFGCAMDGNQGNAADFSDLISRCEASNSYAARA